MNDMRLGDLDALLDKFLRSYTEQEKVGNFQFVACEIKQNFADMVCEQPTIDAVPVVQLMEMLSNLERMCRGGDEGETYTTGYRNGHHNGQIELLRYILQVPDGTSEDERKDGGGNG